MRPERSSPRHRGRGAGAEVDAGQADRGQRIRRERHAEVRAAEATLRSAARLGVRPRELDALLRARAPEVT
jgi:hypothetical protein